MVSAPGVVDQLRHGGFGTDFYEFHGGARAFDTDAYFNRRAECWGLMAQWLKMGAQIPDDPERATDLTSPRHGYSSKSQVQLECKDDMKSRGLASPDCGDVLAMSFSVKIASRQPPERPRESMLAPTEHSWMAM